MAWCSKSGAHSGSGSSINDEVDLLQGKEHAPQIKSRA